MRVREREKSERGESESERMSERNFISTIQLRTIHS